MRKTPLENWIAHEIMGRYDRSLTKDDLLRYQLARLRETIEFVTEKSRFYRNRLAGFSAGDLRGLEDLARFPFTTRQDFRESGPQFLCVSQSEIDRVITPLIPGSAEMPMRTYLTADDLESTIQFFHHGMTSLVDPGQKALILMFGDRPGTVGDLLKRALARTQVQGIVHGTVGDPSEVIREIVQHRIDCLIGIPVEVLSVAAHEDAAKIPSGQIKSVLLSADCRFSTYIPSAIVEELQRVWGCKVFNHYGTTEMGFGGGVECDAHCGCHLREADHYFEIVDPDSDLPLPPGELGEVVVTTLTRKGMPLVRYRTGDLARFRPTPCPCGTVLRTMERVQGRLHEVVRLRTGEWTGIADFDEAFFSVSGIVDYTVTVTAESNVDRMDISIDPGSKGWADSAAITAAALGVPAIRRAVGQGHLIIGNVSTSGTNCLTAGVARKAIVRHSA